MYRSSYLTFPGHFIITDFPQPFLPMPASVHVWDVYTYFVQGLNVIVQWGWRYPFTVLVQNVEYNRQLYLMALTFTCRWWYN